MASSRAAMSAVLEVSSAISCASVTWSTPGDSNRVRKMAYWIGVTWRHALRGIWPPQFVGRGESGGRVRRKAQKQAHGLWLGSWRDFAPRFFGAGQTRSRHRCRPREGAGRDQPRCHQKRWRTPTPKLVPFSTLVILSFINMVAAHVSAFGQVVVITTVDCVACAATIHSGQRSQPESCRSLQGQTGPRTRWFCRRSPADQR